MKKCTIIFAALFLIIISGCKTDGQQICQKTNINIYDYIEYYSSHNMGLGSLYNIKISDAEIAAEKDFMTYMFPISAESYGETSKLYIDTDTNNNIFCIELLLKPESLGLFTNKSELINYLSTVLQGLNTKYTHEFASKYIKQLFITAEISDFALTPFDNNWEIYLDISNNMVLFSISKNE